MNIVSAIIDFTKDGFSVDFGRDEMTIIELPTSDDDPYGFIAKLAEYDIEFETPHYIPEGFVLTEVDTTETLYAFFWSICTKMCQKNFLHYIDFSGKL